PQWRNQDRQLVRHSGRLPDRAVFGRSANDTRAFSVERILLGPRSVVGVRALWAIYTGGMAISKWRIRGTIGRRNLRYAEITRWRVQHHHRDKGCKGAAANTSRDRRRAVQERSLRLAQ